MTAAYIQWGTAGLPPVPVLTTLDLLRAASMADEGGVSAAIIEGEALFAASMEGIHYA